MPQLPALRYSNALVDFSPVSNALDANRKNALEQRDSARQDEMLGMRRQEFDYNRQRTDKADARAQIERGAQMATAIGSMSDNDPAKPVAWKRYLSTYGDGDHTPEELDFRTGPKIAAAAAGKFLDPRDSQMKDLELQKTRAEIGQLNRKAEPNPVENYLLQRLQGMNKPQSSTQQPQPGQGQVIPQSFEGAPMDQPGLIRVADQTAAPQVAGGQDAAPDTVDTPYGSMSRNEARQLGGTMLLSPKYAPAGRALLDSIGLGKDGDPSGLAKPTINQLEEKTLNAASQLSRIGDIKKRFSARFLEVPTRMQMLANSWTAKAGGKLNDKQRESLSDYAAFRSSSVNNLNAILKELSGAAVTPQEYERIQNDQPVAGTGIFDGDDPTSFMSKLDRTEKTLKAAVARYNFMRSKGLNFNRNTLDQFLSLDDVPAAIDKRGYEIEQNLRSRNPRMPQQQLDDQVRQQIKREFGI